MAINKSRVVLFLPAWYPNRTDKLAGNFVRSHALALSPLLDVHVLNITGDKNSKKLLEFIEVKDEIKTYIVYYRKPRLKNALTVIYEGFLFGLSVFYGYYKYLSVHKRPNLFHVHVLVRAGILPFMLSFFSTTEYYITEHWTRYLPEEATFKGGLRRFLAKKVVDRSSGISAVSQALLNALNSYGLVHSNQVKISNVLRPKFLELSREENEGNNVKHFLHVSVFNDKHKNISGILRAFKNIEELGKKFKLTLVGDGKDKLQIEKYAQTLALSNVYFTGLLELEELTKIYVEADAVVLFSEYENQPSVILEAHALGIPVIGTRAGGIPELIHDGFGILVETKDVNDLTKKISAFIDDQYIFDSKKMIAHAKANYSSETVGRAIFNFYA